jgi:hypothetical protein
VARAAPESVNAAEAERCLDRIRALWRRMPKSSTLYAARRCESLGLEAAIRAEARRYLRLMAGCQARPPHLP